MLTATLILVGGWVFFWLLSVAFLIADDEEAAAIWFLSGCLCAGSSVGILLLTVIIKVNS